VAGHGVASKFSSVNCTPFQPGALPRLPEGLKIIKEPISRQKILKKMSA
jgi:hypothetical protein